MTKTNLKADAPPAPKRWQDPLAPLTDNLSLPATWGLIFLAWLVGAVARYRWLHFANGVDAFKWHGVPLTNTNDTYLYASIIQKAHFGTMQGIPDCPGIMTHGMITVLPTLLLKVLPASVTIDHLMAWLPVLLGGLIVIPVVLIGRLYGSTVWGFCAALLAAVSNSYFNRTLAGYYDTDLFAVTIPTLALYFLLAGHKHESLRMTGAAAFTLFAYPFFYNSGATIAFALGIAYIGVLVLFHFKSPFTWRSVLIIGLALAFLENSIGGAIAARPLTWLGQLALIIAACIAVPRLFLAEQLANREKRMGLIALVVLVAGYVFVVAGPGQKIYARAAQYTGAATGKLAEPTEAIKFHNSLSTVQEAVTATGSLKEKARTMGERTTGSAAVMFVALVGYVLLVLWRQEFLIAAPLLGVGIFAIWGGYRFTMHATAIAALAWVYAAFVVTQLFSARKLIVWSVAGAATIAAIVPNIRHLLQYNAPTVLENQAVEVLDIIKPRVKPGDYLLTWWDYGTAGWYYSGLRTVCDPINQGDDIYLAAKALNSPSQRLAANLMRLGIETHAQTNRDNSAIRTLLEPRLKDFSGLDGFFKELESPAFKLPPKTREVYLFLPTMLLYMVPPMRQFSERDLLTGKMQPGKTIQIYDKAEMSDREVSLYAGGRPVIVVDRKTLVATILADGRHFNLHTLDFIQRSPRRNLSVSRQLGDPNSSLHLTLSLDPPLSILMDREIFQSNLMQMFLYEIFDPNLFEPVAFNAKAKLYRLKN